MTDEERWRPVPGYEGLYDVSDHGRVRSHHREPNTLLRQSKTPRYLTVGLAKNGERRMWHVHRLVLLAFVGPLPEGMQSRHLDGDETNNHLSNLTYGTVSQNVLDKVRHGTYRNGQNTKTECIRGHAFDDENTYVNPRGHRVCRTCSRMHNARRGSGECRTTGCTKPDKAARGLCWKHYRRTLTTQGD